MTWHNWAGNQRTDPKRTVVARTVEDVVAAVSAAQRDGSKVKALGSGHSFTAIGVPEDVAVVVPGDPAHLRVDPATNLVTVPAGLRLRELNALLWARGLSMPNLGDIDAQTIAGAISTGTHGTGAGLTGIAGQVRGLEMVLADGRVLTCSPTENADVFAAARVGLGALGVLVGVTLQTEPAFRLHAREEGLPFDGVLADLDRHVAENEHFEFFWFPHTDIAAAKSNNRTEATGPVRTRMAEFVGEELITNGVFGLACRIGDVVPALVPRMNRLVASQFAASEYVDRSYRVFVSPRRVRFVEMEYAIPRAAIHEALAALRAAVDRHAQGVMFPVEVRFAAADDIPLSTASGRDSAYIAVHVHRGQPHDAYFGAVEAIMSGLGGRPHWGKLHTQTAASLRERYPEFDNFVALRDKLDPERRFTNAYLERVLGP
ncbi:D-arabinono-1,4-lactone oxidase [Pseudonocardia sp. GCM10023141]|uniref:D-arabinono-1,4-lactone oxidase n=1 Tax=Pseudonocardia sp. GCM10023141 TaxID=3252653 RepID=UPI0036219CA1